MNRIACTSTTAFFRRLIASIANRLFNTLDRFSSTLNSGKVKHTESRAQRILGVITLQPAATFNVYHGFKKCGSDLHYIRQIKKIMYRITFFIVLIMILHNVE